MNIPLLERLKAPIRDFVLRHANTSRGTYALALISVLESLISPVPLEVILAPLVMARPARWFFYATVATAASVFGAIIGYGVGYLLFDAVGQQIISFYNLSDNVLAAKELLSEHMFSTTFISAFTPIPYKVFVLTAGVLGGPLGVFVLASVLGRGIRFFVFSYIVHRYGAFVARIMYRYFTVATLIFVALVVSLLVFIYM